MVDFKYKTLSVHVLTLTCNKLMRDLNNKSEIDLS